MKWSKISWCMAGLTVDLIKHNGPTPADFMAAQIITDCGKFTLDFKQHGFCFSPLLLVHIFQCNFFLPVNFAFNVLWYSTPWTAAPFSNDPLWLNLFVEGVSDRLLDHCQVSSVPQYCGFKEQEIPTSYTVGMVIYRNSNVNVLIFWETDFWLSLAVSSNHQI